MDENILYKRIAEEIRQDILSGKQKAGSRLPSIRELTHRWNCTTGTIQRAYQELSRQGLVVSRAGKGTHVSSDLNMKQFQVQIPLRRASMVHRAEAFLLESLTSGFDLEEIQQAVNLAMDRWRTLQVNEPSSANPEIIRFSGSHDMAMVWLSNHIAETITSTTLQLNFNGSLGGLMALAEGKAELAGCHLWDIDSNTYNEPFIRKLFPGKKMLMIHIANRRIGLIVSPNNPKGINRLQDLTQPSVRFVNRQSGSGTRVWLDANLHQFRIDPAKIDGYEDEKTTHSEVARMIAEGKADAGIGIESAAAVYSLGFVPLDEECYDLVTYDHLAERSPLRDFIQWLNSNMVKQTIEHLDGYNFSHIGDQKLLDV